MLNAFIEIDGKVFTGNELEKYSLNLDQKLQKEIPKDQRLLFENPR